MAVNSRNPEKWPEPKYDNSDQPHFLFIITPPYSGSTALSELLNTSHRTMILHPKGEGQWLVPGLCEPDRWNKEKKVNYHSVKATWLSTYQHVNRLTQNIDVVIEKSPPNMMRMERVSSQFREFSFIAYNRDPYASCASILYRTFDVAALGPGKRLKVLARLTASWLERSERIKELVSTLNAPLFTYEEFCRTPAALIERLPLPGCVIESMNKDARVSVKDYEVQPISNQNRRQMSRLSDNELERVSETLRPHRPLLEYFGYELMH